jgi:hypothetical protein
LRTFARISKPADLSRSRKSPRGLKPRT